MGQKQSRCSKPSAMSRDEWTRGWAAAVELASACHVLAALVSLGGRVRGEHGWRVCYTLSRRGCNKIAISRASPVAGSFSAPLHTGRGIRIAIAIGVGGTGEGLQYGTGLESAGIGAH